MPIRTFNCPLLAAGLGFAMLAAGADAPAQSPAARSRVVLVRTVILCDDDGSHPARSVFPTTRVNRVYTRADLEFLYLDPVHWPYGKGRRGEVNLDTIMAQGRANGMIATDPRVVALRFGGGRPYATAGTRAGGRQRLFRQLGRTGENDRSRQAGLCGGARNRPLPGIAPRRG